MQYKFHLTANDYLAHQLYGISQSKAISWQRKRSWIITTIVMWGLAAGFYYYNNSSLSIYFAIIGTISLIFHPYYTKWRYQNIFKKHINENYASTYDELITITFQENQIYSSEGDSHESTITHDQIIEITELKDQFLILLEDNQSLIIPKSKIEQLDSLTDDLNHAAKKAEITILNQKSWEWK